MSDITATDAPDDKPSAIPPEELAALTDDIVAAMKSVYDPEIPVDIYELGLIYKVDVSDDMVADAVRSVDGVGDVNVTLTFDPPWDQSLMSDEARLALNMY